MKQLTWGLCKNARRLDDPTAVSQGVSLRNGMAFCHTSIFFELFRLHPMCLHGMSHAFFESIFLCFSLVTNGQRMPISWRLSVYMGLNLNTRHVSAQIRRLLYFFDFLYPLGLPGRTGIQAPFCDKKVNETASQCEPGGGLKRRTCYDANS